MFAFHISFEEQLRRSTLPLREKTLCRARDEEAIANALAAYHWVGQCHPADMHFKLAADLFAEAETCERDASRRKRKVANLKARHHRRSPPAASISSLSKEMINEIQMRHAQMGVPRAIGQR